jgi:cytochrome c biogenesis protein CcmG/thiol:disulfide interchange protein DsbE
VPLDLHFGLGASTTIDSLEVHWPSGEVEKWTDLPVDQLLVIREGESTVEAHPLNRWPESSRPSIIGSPSPTVEAEQLNGGVAPLAGGRPTVINFWAPWCAPCQVELPQLVDLAARYRDEVDFVGVSVELKDQSSVRATLEQFGVPYPQFLADETLMARFFGDADRASLPSTFVFDDQGGLRRIFRGAITEADLDALLSSFRDEGLSEDHLSLLARVYFDAGNYDKAIDYYRRLVDLEPHSIEQVGLVWERRRAMDRFNLGRARLRSGRAVEAVADLQTAQQSLGDDHAVLLELGVAAAFAGQLRLAGDALERAVRLNPESVRGWLNKARVHRAQGETNAAQDSYAHVLRLDPANAQARQELAALRSGHSRPR